MRDRIPTYNSDTNEVRFILTNDMKVVCPHCQSGFIIITVGITDHQITMMANCTIRDAKRAFYCPYCGKDMTDIFRWENKTE